MNLIRRFVVRRQTRAAIRFLMKMDKAMMRRGYNHQQKKQAWADFIKSPAARMSALLTLYSAYGGNAKKQQVKLAIPKKAD